MNWHQCPVLWKVLKIGESVVGGKSCICVMSLHAETVLKYDNKNAKVTASWEDRMEQILLK